MHPAIRLTGSAGGTAWCLVTSRAGCRGRTPSLRKHRGQVGGVVVVVVAYRHLLSTAPKPGTSAPATPGQAVAYVRDVAQDAVAEAQLTLPGGSTSTRAPQTLCRFRVAGGGAARSTGQSWLKSLLCGRVTGLRYDVVDVFTDRPLPGTRWPSFMGR